MAVEELRRRARRAPLARRRSIDLDVPGQHHAVILLRLGAAHEPRLDIRQHALGLAIEGMPPAAAAAGLDPHDIAAENDVAVAQGLEETLVGTTRVDDAAPASRSVTAGNTPGRILDSIDAHRNHGLLRQHLDLADKPAAAAPASRP